MSWTEVHDEAEHLEHAVSDRLIERIDEMLGRPSADPHGDPIPGPEGTLEPPGVRHAADLPAGRSRHRPPRQRSGQRVPALRRAPRSQAGTGRARRGSRPGRRQRQAARRSDREFTIGARAASKVLVQAARAVRADVRPRHVRIRADAAERRSPRAEPFAITDNSFLVEEAFNQEAGIFQNIVGAIVRERQLGIQLHAGVAGRLAGAPVLVHAVGARQRRRIGHRRHAAELPLSGADRRDPDGRRSRRG